MKLSVVLVFSLLSFSNATSVHEKASSQLDYRSSNILENLKEEPVVDIERDIFSHIFRENVLQTMEPEFLVRLFEATMRGREILPGRSMDIETAFKKMIRSKSDEEVVEILGYAYVNKYDNAIAAIISTISKRFPDIMQYIKDSGRYSEEFVTALKHFKAEFGIETDYDVVWHTDCDGTRPFIEMNDMLTLRPDQRLPAAIRQILKNDDLLDYEITSKFIKEHVLPRFDFRTALVLYELEMMDKMHIRDTDGVIAKHLKWTIFYKSNEEMANLVLDMFIEGFWSAFKFIIDNKFSFKSPLANPIWFKDLKFLFDYATAHFYPEEFFAKVIEFADANAIRHYNAIIRKSLGEFDELYLDNGAVVDFAVNVAEE